MLSQDLDLLQVEEIEYESMNVNQVENILYGPKNVERFNDSHRKTIQGTTKQ